mgnify:CR=1 FL=1
MYDKEAALRGANSADVSVCLPGLQDACGSCVC